MKNMPRNARAVERERDRRDAQPADAEQPQRDERVGRRATRQRRTRRAGRRRRRAAPSTSAEPQPSGVGADDAVDEREQAGGAEHGAGEVEARGRRCARLSATNARRGRDRPRCAIGTLTKKIHCQPAASTSTPPATTPSVPPMAGERAPDAERDVALAAGGEGDGQQRERGGGEQRGADALDGADRDEHARRGREPAGERGGREQGEADQEHRGGGRAGRSTRPPSSRRPPNASV